MKLPLILTIGILASSVAAQTCDPIINHPDHPILSLTCDPLDTSADGFGIHYRVKGDTEWTLAEDRWCIWSAWDAYGNRVSVGCENAVKEDCETCAGILTTQTGVASECRRWCRLDEIGWPIQRYLDLPTGTSYEFAATAFNQAGRSGYSNLVPICATYTCRPDLDKVPCAEP